MEAFEFRRVLGHLATGVSVLATRTDEGLLRGLTVTAVSSLSLQPPLVLACVDTMADSHDSVASAGRFAISILASEHEALARRFAECETERKFDGVAYRAEVTGSPVLEGALAWVDCRLHHAAPGGDHTIFIGEVVAGDARDGAPLLHYRGGYGRFLP